MTDERRYTEAELHAIFERAAERQEAARRAEAAGGDQLTLTELQEIGAASGIDPAHVAAAAAELDTVPPADVHRFLGAPTEVRRTRLLPGEVSDETWAQMVAEVRRTFGDDGSIGQIGPMREWTATKRGASNSDRPTRLVVEPAEGGGTRATLRQSVRETTRGLKVGAIINGAFALFFLVLAAAGTDPGMWIPAVIMAGLALSFGGITRGWLGYWNGQQQEKFDAVLDRLELIARSDAPERPSEAERSAPSGRIDLDDLPDEPEGTSTTERTRTRS